MLQRWVYAKKEQSLLGVQGLRFEKAGFWVNAACFAGFRPVVEEALGCRVW